MSPPSPTHQNIGSRHANLVLQTTRNGRKFLVDGKPLDLNVPFETINKHLVSHFDFKEEIKNFYIKSLCSTGLTRLLSSFTINTNAFPQVTIETDPKLDNYYTNPSVSLVGQNGEQKPVPDYTFVVKLSVDPHSLETLKHQALPNSYRSRRVVYEKSPNPAMDYRFISRSRMMPPHPQQPHPQLYANLTTFPQPAMPAHIGPQTAYEQPYPQPPYPNANPVPLHAPKNVFLGPKRAFPSPIPPQQQQQKQKKK